MFIDRHRVYYLLNINELVRAVRLCEIARPADHGRNARADQLAHVAAAVESAASFDVNVARAALSQGYHPNSISTDIHVRNIDGPVFDIATVMTKLLDCGLPLLDVIVAVTSAPRRILDMDSVWLGPEGIIQHATLFRLAERPPAGRTYIDAGGNASYPHKHIAAAATIRAGIARACGASPPKTS